MVILHYKDVILVLYHVLIVKLQLPNVLLVNLEIFCIIVNVQQVALLDTGLMVVPITVILALHHVQLVQHQLLLVHHVFQIIIYNQQEINVNLLVQLNFGLTLQV